MKTILQLTIIILISLFLSGCFSKYFMSDKEVNLYYKMHGPKPNFYTYDTLGRKIFYAFANEKRIELPLLILIHGAPGAWYGYIHYLEDSFLLTHFRIISVDRTGYNHSAIGGVEVIIEQQAKLLLPLLSKANGTKCIVAARSYGAPIAVRMATLKPDNLSALLLTSCAANIL